MYYSEIMPQDAWDYYANQEEFKSHTSAYKIVMLERSNRNLI